MNKLTFIAFAVLLIAGAQAYGCCDANTIDITGAGSVQVNPDIATFSVSAQGYGKTSASALTNVNRLINQAMNVLKNYGLPTANYTTSAINLNPQYNYTGSITVLVGQQASQTLQVTIGNLPTAGTNLLGQIATSLANINNLTVSGFSFQNSDTVGPYRQARLAAVADAAQKAAQYCSLSGRQLGKVRKVVDQNSESYVPFVIDPSFYAFQAKVVSVPYGKVTVNANVEINWLISN